MMRFLQHFAFGVAILMVFASCSKQAVKTPLKLWYEEPADASVDDNPFGWRSDPEWLKALPLGNGSLGAMVFGDVNLERIQLNEETLWSGSPDDNDNPDAYPALEIVRSLLFEGKYKEANDLTNKAMICKGAGTGLGSGANVPFGSYQTLGDLWIDFGNQGEYQNYYRELDLHDAAVRVKYTRNGIDYHREIFVSEPDQVMVVRLTASQPGSISFSCSLSRPERYTTRIENDMLIMEGSLHDGKGGEGMQYMARLSAVNKNGKVLYDNAKLIVEEADEVILLLSASTDYLLKYPDYNGRDFRQTTLNAIREARGQSYRELLKRHTKDYQTYFHKASLKLTPGSLPEVPTDKRIEQFKTNKDDLHLVELLFQFGRYLLISSSRPGTMPANLQGIWSNKIQTPWNGDYHTNINIQMNYWPAGVGNLSELQLPLFDLMESLIKPGQKTAWTHYRANGWIVHPVTNVWGYTSPGENAKWGLHAGAGAWLCSHITEHYAFTGDKDFLKKMYPVMQGSVGFYLDWLVEDPFTGKLVSGPAGSPENTFIAPDGTHGQISMGPAHDQQLIAQLFSDYIFISNELETESDLAKIAENALEKLAMPGIGSDGRLMEWAVEFEEAEPGHRHISHLFALHPGNQITREKEPELFAAAKKSLDYRIAHGGGHTGWSAAWLINLYARLYESQDALDCLHTVITRSTSPNLFGLHPPFQIDSNFGTTAGIAEMLIQSHDGVISLLPALPVEWDSGKATGLSARGGYQVDMEWDNGTLTKARVFSEKGGQVIVRFGDQQKEINIRPGKYARFI